MFNYTPDYFSHFLFQRGGGISPVFSSPMKSPKHFNSPSLQLRLDRPYSITCHYPSYIRKSHYCSTLEITSLCEPRCHSLRCSAAISLEQHFPALSRAGETRHTGTAIFHIPTCQANRKLPAAGEVCTISPFTKTCSFPQVK